LNGADLESRLVASLPELRGRLKAEASLKDLTWFRAGGPAEVLYSPADESDLAYFLTTTPSDIPITVIGLGSNLLVRDGGIEGVVIRLGRGFGEIKIEDNYRLRAGTAVPDVKVARAAADAGIAGLSFYRGIPGCVGGALRMNGGAHGRETREVLVEARAVDRKGNVHVLPVLELHYAYRYCGAPEDFIFTEALFQGELGARDDPRRDG
jgi:UDP-N-acetylmuramate dehydrogenase